jgi:hypothetical protein
MFKLDAWEALMTNEDYDQSTVAVAKELAFEMCAELIDRLGMSAVTDEAALRISGRGLTFLIPLRGNSVPMKYAGKKGFLAAQKKPGRRGRPLKSLEPLEAIEDLELTEKSSGLE